MPEGWALCPEAPALPQEPVSSQQVSSARKWPEGLRTSAPGHVSGGGGLAPRGTVCIWGEAAEATLGGGTIWEGGSYLGGALSAKGLRASRDRASASLARSLPARWMTHSCCS